MKKVAIGVALANTSQAVDPEQVYSFIEAQSQDVETYELAPPPPGSIRAAALDYMLLLSIAGSAASIASILWMAYEKFIASKKNNDSSGIVVVIRKDDGTNDQFWIGHTDKSREVFVQTFTKKVETIRRSKATGESTERVNEELSVNSMWTRRK